MAHDFLFDSVGVQLEGMVGTRCAGLVVSWSCQVTKCSASSGVVAVRLDFVAMFASPTEA